MLTYNSLTITHENDRFKFSEIYVFQRQCDLKTRDIP